MSQLSISQVAHQVGLRASAIRYYEQIGLLPAALRVTGRRRYDASVFHRLAIIQRARQLSFYVRRNPTVILRLRQCHAGFGALAEAVATEARGTRRFDGRDKDGPAPVEKDDAELM